MYIYLNTYIYIHEYMYCVYVGKQSNVDRSKDRIRMIECIDVVAIKACVCTYTYMSVCTSACMLVCVLLNMYA